MIRASIDIGSNTVLLLLGDVDSHGHFTELENESRVTSLGKNLDKLGAFEKQSMEDTYQALSEYRQIIDRHQLDPAKVIVTATEASRVAKNSGELFERVLKDLGLSVTIISSEGEAFYTAFGVWKMSKFLNEKELVIMDIGGASTEFIKLQTDPFDVVESISLPFGAVRGTDWLREDIFDEKMNEILGHEQFLNYSCRYLLCVAGSMTSLGGMLKGLSKFEPKIINGMAISFRSFEKFYNSIVDKTPQFLLSKFPFLGKRSNFILAGAKIGIEVGKRLGVEEFNISTLGLRYGTLLSGSINERFIEQS